MKKYLNIKNLSVILVVFLILALVFMFTCKGPNIYDKLKKLYITQADVEKAREAQRIYDSIQSAMIQKENEDLKEKNRSL